MKRPDDDTPDVAEVLEAMKRDIASRLRPVCDGMPEDEFAKLVEDVARVNVKYRARRTDDMFDAMADQAARERTKPA